MPPKQSSSGTAAGYLRRNNRSTARKSVGAPTLIKCSSTATTPFHPPNDDASPTSIDDEIATTTATTESAVVGVTGKNAVPESVDAVVLPDREERGKDRSGERVVGDEGKETLIEERVEIGLGESEMGRDSAIPVIAEAMDVVEGAGGGGVGVVLPEEEEEKVESLIDETIVSGNAKETLVEAKVEIGLGAGELGRGSGIRVMKEDLNVVEGVAGGGVGVSGGGKTKKIVKKVVKVVRRVVKKVPKKVSKVDDLKKDDALASSVENAEPPSVSVGEEKGVEKGVDERDGMEIEQSRIGVEDKMDKGYCNNEISVTEDLLDPQLKSAQPIRVGGEEVSTGHLDSNRGNSMEENKALDLLFAKAIRVGGEGVTIEHIDAKSEGNVQGGNSIVELSANGVGDAEKCANEVSESAAAREDEVGAGAYMSTEMEAVERQKKRKTEVFIGGLNKDVKEEDIRKIFGEVGEIVEVRLLMESKTGKNKGYAFVRYASAAEAKRAAKQFSKVEICGKESGASLVEGSDTLYLGNIDKKWKEEDVMKLLQGAGIDKIDNVTVIKDPVNGDCNRGFAFVEFETSKCAQVAHNKLQKKDAFGINRKLKVAWAEPLAEPDEEEMLKVKTVFAEFIPSTWDEKKVREIFIKFGEIENVVLSRDMLTSKRKDYAFISYERREAAVACIDSLGSELTDDDGNKVTLKVCFAKPVSKGKHLKKDTKSHTREVNNDRPKPNYGSVRDLRSQGRQVDPRSHGKHIDPRSQGRLITPQHQNYGVQMASTNAELVQLLREQAAQKPLYNNLNTGSIDINYSNPLLGRKRPFSSMEAGPVLRGHSHSYMETTLPVAGPSYNLPPPVGAVMSSSYYHPHGGHRPELQLGARAYAPTETRERHPDGRNVVYRSY